MNNYFTDLSNNEPLIPSISKRIPLRETKEYVFDKCKFTIDDNQYSEEECESQKENVNESSSEYQTESESESENDSDSESDKQQEKILSPIEKSPRVPIQPSRKLLFSPTSKDINRYPDKKERAMKSLSPPRKMSPPRRSMSPRRSPARTARSSPTRKARSTARTRSPTVKRKSPVRARSPARTTRAKSPSKLRASPKLQKLSPRRKKNTVIYKDSK